MMAPTTVLPSLLWLLLAAARPMAALFEGQGYSPGPAWDAVVAQQQQQPTLVPDEHPPAVADEPSPSCASALAGCWPVRNETTQCKVCEGHQQHRLAVAGCSEADISRYCGTQPAAPPVVAQWYPLEAGVCVNGAPAFVYAFSEPAQKGTSDDWVVQFGSAPGLNFCIDEEHCAIYIRRATDDTAQTGNERNAQPA